MKVFYCDVCKNKYERKTNNSIINKDDGRSTYHFKFSYLTSWDSTYYDICPKCLKQAILDMVEKWRWTIVQTMMTGRV